MFSLRQLKYFVAAAESGRISEAAEQLHISQSAVTTAIRDLENLLGFQLLERSPAGVDLTAAGRRFLSHAYSVLAAADEAMSMPHEKVAISGELRLAATYTLLGYFLPHHLQRFSMRYPDIEVRVEEMKRDAIEKSLIAGNHDLGMLITANVNNAKIACETYLGSERRLWVAAKHRLLDQPIVTFEDVSHEPFIMLTVDEAADSAMRYWARTRYRPNILLQTSSVEAVRSMVANGMGVAILSDMVYRPWSLEGRRIETITLRDSVPSMDVGLAWKSSTAITPAMGAFRDYFRHLYLDPLMAGSRTRVG